MPDLFGRSGIRGNGGSRGGGGSSGNSLFERGGFGMHVSLDMFFDRAFIINAMDAKTKRVLSSTGAFARTVMQRGMKYRNSASKPGDYPSARQGSVKKGGNSLLREKVRFGYDAGKKDLVVGPALLDSPDKEVTAAGKTVPELINYGGTVMRRQIFDPKKKQIRPLRHGQHPIPWHYRPRPFVELTLPKAVDALRQNMEKIPLK